MADHTTTMMDRDLSALSDRISEVGHFVQRMLVAAIDAIVENDVEAAKRVVALDHQVDVLHLQIEELAILTIARRQPVGKDLREILAAMRISRDLERIGDLAKNIAKRAVILSKSRFFSPHVADLQSKSEFVVLQLKDILDAYVRRDEWRAEAIWIRNFQSDAEFEELSNNVVSTMIKKPRDITASTQLLFCSKNLDHIIGHIKNVANAIQFMVTGEALAEVVE